MTIIGMPYGASTQHFILLHESLTNRRSVAKNVSLG